MERVVSPRHANERMPIYCNQCPPREEVHVRRKRRIGFRTSCAREASCACWNMAARGWIPPPYTEITCVKGGIVADVKLALLILIHDGSPFVVVFNWRRFVIVFCFKIRLKMGLRNIVVLKLYFFFFLCFIRIGLVAFGGFGESMNSVVCVIGRR